MKSRLDFRSIKSFLEMIGTSAEDVKGAIEGYEKVKGKPPKFILLPHPHINIFGVRICFSTTEERSRELMLSSSETVILGVQHNTEFTKH